MKPGMDRVHAHGLCRPVERDVLRERPYRALRRVVGGRRAEAAGGAEDRADVDHRAVTGRLQRIRARLHPEKDAGLIDRDGSLPVGERRLLDRGEVAEPGVVDEDVEAAALGEHALDRGTPRLLVRDVEVDEERLPARLADPGRRLLPGLVLDVRDDDGRPFARKPLCGGTADPLAAPVTSATRSSRRFMPTPFACGSTLGLRAIILAEHRGATAARRRPRAAKEVHDEDHDRRRRQHGRGIGTRAVAGGHEVEIVDRVAGKVVVDITTPSTRRRGTDWRRRRELHSSSPTSSASRARSSSIPSADGRHDAAAQSAPRGLEADEGHAAPLCADHREDPARDHTSKEPLVERCALRRRSWSHDAAPSSPRYDVRDHGRLRRRRPRVATADRRTRAFQLEGLSVADFDARIHAVLEDLGVDVEIEEVPFGVPMTTPFPEDREHAAWDGDRPALRAHPRLVGFGARGVQRLVQRQDEPGAALLAQLRPRRDALLRAAGADTGNDPVSNEAYSHEVISFGFWAGDDDRRRCRLLLVHRSRTGWSAGATAAGRRLDPVGKRIARPAPIRDRPHGGRPPNDAPRLLRRRVRGRRSPCRLGHHCLLVPLVPDTRSAGATASVGGRRPRTTYSLRLSSNPFGELGCCALSRRSTRRGR